MKALVLKFRRKRCLMELWLTEIMPSGGIMIPPDGKGELRDGKENLWD